MTPTRWARRATEVSWVIRTRVRPRSRHRRSSRAMDGREILVRCYVPEGSGSFPGHLYLHGGAFWAGSVADYDPLCRWYAAAAGCFPPRAATWATSPRG